MNSIEEQGRAYQEFIKGLWKENPTFVSVLGMCPTLAVTNSAINGLAMGLATTVVLVASCYLVSVLRNWIPKQVRITTFVVIIATFVSAVDFSLQAAFPKIHKELGAFIALIVVNCIILGRQEAFSYKNTPWLSILDALGMGFGFVCSLLALGGIREILGNGSFFGVSLFGPNFEPWVIMILPPGGFLLLGFLMLFVNWYKSRQAERAKLQQIQKV
jgi:electron transport complex protein RnfE